MSRLVLSAALLAACATVPTAMRVSLDPPVYTPGKASALGIGLLPIAAPPKGVKVRYRWRADRGHFKSWSEVTHDVERFGVEAVNDGGKLYWTYEGAALEPATITIVAENAKNGKVLAETVVRLEWDGELVRVAR